MSDRIQRVYEALHKANDARSMVASGVWDEAWQKHEQELLERLLLCGPDDDVARYRLQIAIEASRQVRRVIENQGRSVASLEKELAHLQGETKSRIA
jgi:hypothetical protein